jgi:hypothetical protein
MVESTAMGAMIRWLMVVGWMSAMFALSSVLSLQSPFMRPSDFIFRTLAHIGEYAVLTALLGWDLQRSMGRTVHAWHFTMRDG